MLREKDYLKPVEVCGHYDSGASKKNKLLKELCFFFVGTLAKCMINAKDCAYSKLRSNFM